MDPKVSIIATMILLLYISKVGGHSLIHSLQTRRTGQFWEMPHSRTCRTGRRFPEHAAGWRRFLRRKCL